MYQTAYTRKCPFFTTFIRYFWLLLALPVTVCTAQVHYQSDPTIRQLVSQLSANEVRRLFSRILGIDSDCAFSIPCLPPVGFWEGNRISSGYGWRRHPISGQHAHHAGIDIAGTHQYIRAAASGLVEQAGYDKHLGYYVRINHQNSFRTMYGHLAWVLVQAGQPVQIGDKIGILGQSGAATGLHLHYAITKNGVHLDPAPYLTLAINLVNWYQQQTKPIADLLTK